MDLLESMKTMVSEATNYIESKNFYFENHNCEKNGNTVKVQLDFILSNETTDKILRFGQCPHCKKLFYHRDYSDKSF